MPTNQLAPPDMPWLTGNVASTPNGLGPPLLNYAAPPDPTTSQGADVLAGKAQQAWQWLQDQRAESVRQGLLDPNTGLPTQAGLVAAAGQTAQGVMMGTTAPGDVPPPGIVAYHGSPHSFDQFDTSKIGTGEGAQAYGHGLYFAGNEGVAQAYRKNLSGPAPSFTGEIAPEFLEALKADDNLGFDNASQAIAAIRSHPDWPQRWDPTDPQKLQALFEAHEQSKYGGQGSMYQVNIGADPDSMLHWDKPLSEQPQNVQDALAAKVDRMKQETDPLRRPMQSWLDQYDKGTLPGSSVYASLGQGSPESAAAAWQAAGIPGIRYLDQGSRNAGGWHITPPDQTVSGKWMVKSNDYNSQGMHFDNEADARAALDQKIGGQTHNYVVFDASTIDILRKYGIAGLIAGGGAAAAGTQQQQPQPTPGS